MRGLLLALMPLFLVWTGFTTAASATLSPELYLSKIAQRLTGQWPTPEDNAELESAESQKNCSEVTCLEDFFRAYIQKQLNTSNFYSEAALKVFERFNYQAPRDLPFPGGFLSSGSDGNETDLLLIYRIFSGDLSIDELYTSQVYWSSKTTNPAYQHSGTPFLANIEGLKSSQIQTLDVTHDSNITMSEIEIEKVDLTGHPNISGLYSTPRFLTRYWNTPVNGNRKRAAAVFRTLLCDSLSPSIERATQKEREEALARGQVDSKVAERTLEEIHRNRHANQADCKACHQRLEPMAQTMRPLEIGVAQFAVPGRLRYNSALNEMVDIRVNNFHDLVVKATQQEKYADCQMNWLITWILGKDVKLHPLRFIDMLDRFNASGHKVKTAITDLLLSPEFQNQTPKITEPASLQKARSVLSNCSECHYSFFNTHGEQLKANLLKIAFKLDLVHNGAHPLMPPSYHWWSPTNEQILDIKKWLQEGAPLMEGKPFLSTLEIRRVLGEVPP